MSVRPKGDVLLTFGPVDQRRGKRHLPPGRLLLAENARQLEEKVYGKRNGYGQLNRTTDVGSITAGRDIAVVGSHLLLRNQDGLYLRDVPNNRYVRRANFASAMPTYEVALPAQGHIPTMCIDSSGRTWHFAGAQKRLNDTITSRPYYRVVEADGREVVPATPIPGITGHVHVSACFFAAGSVWFLYAKNETFAPNLYVAKFNLASPAAAPAITTAYSATPNVGLWINWVDAMPTTTDPVVYFSNSSNAFAFYLNTTTGLPRASPGVVASPAFVNGGLVGIARLFKNETGASGNYYAVVATATESVELVGINATTLAQTVLDGGITNPMPAGTLNWSGTALGGLSGYRDSNGDVTVYVSNSRGTLYNTQVLIRFHRTAAGVKTATAFDRSLYLASDPALVDGTWYIVAGHDDNPIETSNAGLLGTLPADQRAYYLLNGATGEIIARALYDQGGGDLHQFAGMRVGTNWTRGYVSPVFVSGSSISLPLSASRDGLLDFHSVRVQFDLSNTAVGPMVMAEGDVIVPGGFPMRVQSDGWPTDTGPAVSPRSFAYSWVAGAGSVMPTGTFFAAILYATHYPDGRTVRSGLSEIKEITSVNGEHLRIAAPTMRVGRPTGRVVIEVYVSPVGKQLLYFRQAAQNDRTVDTVDIEISSLHGLSELLYTEGGVLENTPCPPFRYGWYWNRRVFVTGTDQKGDVWYSKEIEAGEAPVFSALLKFNVGEVDVFGGQPIDENYCAVFTADGPFLISGDGLDNAGGGSNFAPKKIKAPGSRNPWSLRSCKAGCLYQAKDGGAWIITPSLTSVFLGRGLDDYRGQLVTASVDVPVAQQVRLFVNDGAPWVFDYGRTPVDPGNEAEALGQWYRWTGLPAVSAVVWNDVEHHLEADGTVRMEVEGQRFDGTVTPILQRYRVPITFAGIGGFVRACKGLLVANYLGQHQLRLTVSRDDLTPQVFGPKVLTAGPEQLEFLPPGRGSYFELLIEELQNAGALTAGFELEGLAFTVQTTGLQRVGMGRRT